MLQIADISLAMNYCNIVFVVENLTKFVLVTTLTPFLLLYLSSFILYIYKEYCKLRTPGRDFEIDINPALKLVSSLWVMYAKLWNGFEVDGLENIPTDGPALLVYYHGSIPLDQYYMVAKIHLQCNRRLHSVVDKFWFKIPGFQSFLDGYQALPGSLQSCSAILKNNGLLAVSPGGVYEAQFSSSEKYDILWKQRLGFAKVAIDAKCAILPVFTENINEAYRYALFGNKGRQFYEKLYNRMKIPLSLVYGGFPVKLITHIGKPIPYDAELSPEELKIKVVNAVNGLIMKHQKLPGNIAQALLDRIPENSIMISTQNV